MAKNIVEKAPEFSINNPISIADLEYFNRYKATDSKGRYLYWDKFKWRVKEGDDVKKAWFATKFNRLSIQKSIELKDKNQKEFNFCVPDTLDAKLFKISNIASKGIVPNESIKKQFLISSLITEEAISSSQLEGASTTRKVAKELLVSKREVKTQDERMILNNYLLMKEVKRVKDEDLTIDMILEFHKIATNGIDTNNNVAGKLRESNDIIITDGIEDNIIHQPPLYKELPKRLQKLCDFANTNHSGENGTIFIHPIIKAIILHFMIGYEHPFADGNGRTARALFYWYMLKSGFDYFEYISISKLLKNAPKQYAMSYMYVEIDDNDLTYFIDYQVDIILRAIDELLEYLQQKSKDYEEIVALLKNSKIGNRLNFIQKDIIKKAIKKPGIVFIANEIALDYNISPTTARKYLNELVKLKLLANFKDGRTIAYIAPADIVEVLGVSG